MNLHKDIEKKHFWSTYWCSHSAPEHLQVETCVKEIRLP